MIKLGRLSLNFDLPEWRPAELAGYAAGAKRMRRLASSAGTDGDQFQRACDRLLSCEANAALPALLTDSVHIRAYGYLLNSDQDFAVKHFPSQPVLGAIQSQRWPIGRLTLTNLVRAFANQFGKVPEGALDLLGHFLAKSFELLGPALTGDLTLLSVHASSFCSPQGPASIASKAAAAGSDLDVYLKSVGLSGLKSSAYVRATFTHYFVIQLENLEPGADSPILSELRKPEVHLAVLSEGKLLGHKALEILIDRAPESGPSDAWQKTVIGMAGDPRVGRQSRHYQDWWQFLGEGRAKKVIGWLSRLDLKIFLEVLEAAARTSNNDTIRRMYPPRKKFMEGLLEQGMVVQSRLFLSRDASAYLRRNYEDEDVPEHALIKSGHTSIIYLELATGLHMIEGTDNIKLKILDALPSRPPIMNFGVKVFADSDFRTRLVTTYINEQRQQGRAIKQGVNFLDQAHQGIHWQANAIHLFHQRRIRYEAAKFFSGPDYRTFKSSYDRMYWS